MHQLLFLSWCKVIENGIPLELHGLAVVCPDAKLAETLLDLVGSSGIALRKCCGRGY
jgi:hypothetical protein